jgi:chemotaxis receptor (MCP) glutamine deamidase CheD
MSEVAKHVVVEADAFRVARESLVLACELRAALAVCVHDDTQASGGVLHLRYVATDKDKPLDLTDNTLSSGLLLMDLFCKELRAMGARKQSWRVRIIAHIPAMPELEAPAATVLDLVKAYFADGRLPVQVQELRDPAGVHVRFDPREGYLSAN